IKKYILSYTTYIDVKREEDKFFPYLTLSYAGRGRSGYQVIMLHMARTRSPSSSKGEDPQGDCISPFIAKSRNRSTPLSISQRISSCALPKTEPAGDALQSTALRLANDDDDDDDMMMMMMINFLIIT
ncbi:unnamed protein product, partial [Porites lobata]